MGKQCPGSPAGRDGGAETDIRAHGEVGVRAIPALCLSRGCGTSAHYGFRLNDYPPWRGAELKERETTDMHYDPCIDWREQLPEEKENRYRQLLEHIFFDKDFGAFKKGSAAVDFKREDLERAAAILDIKLPKNLSDVLYSQRYRSPLPKKILETQPEGMEWIIDGVGRARYRFSLVPINRILPNPALKVIKIPDATPEIIGTYALNDEQALLAKVRYNRLIDIFLGVTAYSLQNHMRTTVKSIGQIEIDEVYVALDRRGAQFVIPVQAKGGKDQLAVVQTKQDLACCAEKFPALQCRSVSAQFIDMDDKKSKKIAMFELAVEDERVVIVEEKHYRLVPSAEIGAEELKSYSRN